MADRFVDHGDLGGIRRELFRHNLPEERKTSLRSDLVLHREPNERWFFRGRGEFEASRQKFLAS